MKTTYSAALKASPARPVVDDYGSCFADFVQMKTLALKRFERFGNRNGANANTLGFGKELVRNLGIRVDAVRLAELDAVTETLACNKQEFMMELLVAGIEQAKQAIRLAGLEKRYEETVDRRIAEAGFSMEPSSNEGYWTLHYAGRPVAAETFTAEDMTPGEASSRDAAGS